VQEAEHSLEGQPVIVMMNGRQLMLGQCCTQWMLYLVYAIHGVCWTWCMIYIVNTVLGVCGIDCMLY